MHFVTYGDVFKAHPVVEMISPLSWRLENASGVSKETERGGGWFFGTGVERCSHPTKGGKRREGGGSTKMLVVFSCFWWTGTLKYSDVQNDNYVRDEKIAETDGEERGGGSKDDVTPADRSGNADDILSCIIERVKKEKKLPTFFLFSKATKEQRRRRRRFPVGGSKATNTSHTCKRAGKSPCIDVFFKRKRKEENSKERIGGGRFAPIDRLPLCGFFARGPISRLPKSRERPKSVSTVDWETWAECRRIIRDLFLVFTRIPGLFSFEIAGGQVGVSKNDTHGTKKKCVLWLQVWQTIRFRSRRPGTGLQMLPNEVFGRISFFFFFKPPRLLILRTWNIQKPETGILRKLFARTEIKRYLCF